MELLVIAVVLAVFYGVVSVILAVPLTLFYGVRNAIVVARRLTALFMAITAGLIVLPAWAVFVIGLPFSWNILRPQPPSDSEVQGARMA